MNAVRGFRRWKAVLLAGAVLVVFAASACINPADAEPKRKGRSKEKASKCALVVATVNGQEICRQDLDQKASGLTNTDRQMIYKKEKGVLLVMVEEALLRQEAERRGVSYEDLVAQEIDAKVRPLTETDIEVWYEANKERVRNRPLEAIRERVRPFLVQEREQQARVAFLLPLMKEADLQYFLEPPRVAVSAGNGPTKGPAGAPVTIIEFTDFQCGYCKLILERLDQIAEIYGDNVRFVFRDFPLFIHPDAQKAHEAAQCARDQDKFWPYHDKIFENQKAVKPDNLKGYAEELGLDLGKFNACLDSGEKESVVKAEIQAGREIGVSGTPSFYINGRFLNGYQPVEHFEQIIDDELRLKDIPIPEKPDRESPPTEAEG